jgi:hypothetical protein
MLVQDARELARVRHDAGDVAARREGAQHGPARVLRRGERALERGHVEETVGVDADLNDLGEAPPPREQVGVVLVRPHEDHPPLLRPQLRLKAAAKLRRRRRHAYDLLQALDGRRGASAAEEQRVAASGAHAALHVARRLVHQTRRLAPDVAVLRVRVPCTQVMDGTTYVSWNCLVFLLARKEVLDL